VGTTTAAVLLGGVLEELPDLRICFVHGGGRAPSRWGGWGTAGGSATTRDRAAPAFPRSPSASSAATRSPTTRRSSNCCAPTLTRPDRPRQRLPLRHGAARPGRIPALPRARRRDAGGERPRFPRDEEGGPSSRAARRPDRGRTGHP
jgi:hypothetical protein